VLDLADAEHGPPAAAIERKDGGLVRRIRMESVHGLEILEQRKRPWF
jgi:hypothetical protein